MAPGEERPEEDRPGFGEAMAELTTIVTELESDALDVDHLAERVARAAELVELCRARIDGARFAVEEILGSMDGSATGDDVAAGEEAGDDEENPGPDRG